MRRQYLACIPVVGLTISAGCAGADKPAKPINLSAGAWINLPRNLTSLSPDDLKGRVVMLEFWATW